jgi:hypothetical protein
MIRVIRVIRGCLHCIDTGNKVMYENRRQPMWLSAVVPTCKVERGANEQKKAPGEKQTDKLETNQFIQHHSPSPNPELEQNKGTIDIDRERCKV